MEGDLYDALDQIDVAIAEEDWGEAEATLGEARESFGDEPELLVSEVELALEREDWSECADLAEEYRERVPGAFGAELWALEGYAHFYADRDDRARETFNRAVGGDPELWMAVLGRATVHEHLGFLRAALLDLDRAIEIDDQEAEPFSLRGTVHLQLGNRQKAESDFEYAVEIDPFDASARLHLARLQALDERTTEAMETLELLVDEGEDPEYVMRGALLRSQMAVGLGSTETALEEAERARDVDPEQPWGYLQLAAAHLSGNEPEAALEALDAAAECIDEPRDVPDLFALRATAHERLGREREAEAERERIEGASRLPEVVYGRILNPAEHVPVHPNRPVDVRAILGEIFGDPDAAPPGYADELRELLDEIPEIAEEYPEAGEVEIELPPVEEGGTSPGQIVLELGHTRGS